MVPDQILTGNGHFRNRIRPMQGLCKGISPQNMVWTCIFENRIFLCSRKKIKQNAFFFGCEQFSNTACLSSQKGVYTFMFLKLRFYPTKLRFFADQKAFFPDHIF